DRAARRAVGTLGGGATGDSRNMPRWQRREALHSRGGETRRLRRLDFAVLRTLAPPPHSAPAAGVGCVRGTGGLKPPHFAKITGNRAAGMKIALIFAALVFNA